MRCDSNSFHLSEFVELSLSKVVWVFAVCEEGMSFGGDVSQVSHVKLRGEERGRKREIGREKEDNCDCNIMDWTTHGMWIVDYGLNCACQIFSTFFA